MAENAARQDFSPFNCLAKKIFRPGEIIDTRYVEIVPLVMKKQSRFCNF